MALITTIAELKKYISIDDNVNLSTMQPFIDEAELLFIVDLLGSAFYSEFLAAYTANVAMTGDNGKLLPYVQRCLANYTIMQALPQLATTIGDMGVRQFKADNSDAVPQWLLEKNQFNALKNGDIHAEKLLEFLEANATPNPTKTIWANLLTFNLDGSGDGLYCIQTDTGNKVRYWKTLINANTGNQPPTDPNTTSDANWVEVPAGIYATWAASSANTKNNGYLVRNALIASKYIDISQSRRIFLKLRQKFQEIEARWAPLWVGTDQYNEFIDQIKSNSVSAANQKLIDKITAIVCKMGLHIQLPFIRVSIQSDGLWLYSEPAMTLRDRWFMAESEQIEELRCALKDGELGYVKDQEAMRQFIIANINDYPKIKESTIYTVQPSPGPTWTPPENHWHNKHFVV